MAQPTTTHEPCIWRRQLPPAEPSPAFRSIDDVLLELADCHSGCRRDASDVITRELARAMGLGEVARG